MSAAPPGPPRPSGHDPRRGTTDRAAPLRSLWPGDRAGREIRGDGPGRTRRARLLKSGLRTRDPRPPRPPKRRHGPAMESLATLVRRLHGPGWGRDRQPWLRAPTARPPVRRRARARAVDLWPRRRGLGSGEPRIAQLLRGAEARFDTRPGVKVRGHGRAGPRHLTGLRSSQRIPMNRANRNGSPLRSAAGPTATAAGLRPRARSGSSRRIPGSRRCRDRPGHGRSADGPRSRRRAGAPPAGTRGGC